MPERRPDTASCRLVPTLDGGVGIRADPYRKNKVSVLREEFPACRYFLNVPFGVLTCGASSWAIFSYLRAWFSQISDVFAQCDSSGEVRGSFSSVVFTDALVEDRPFFSSVSFAVSNYSARERRGPDFY